MAKLTFKLTTDGKAITAMAKDLKSRSDSIKPDIHILSCSVVAHAVEHGDATKATLLPTIVTEALGEGWRLNAMRQWFEAIGPFTWVAKTDDKAAGFRINKEKRAKMKADLDKLGETKYLAKLAKSKTFFEFKPEAPYEEFSFKKQLAALIKKAQGKKEDEARVAKGGDDFAGLDKAIDLLEEIASAKPAKATKSKGKAKTSIETLEEAA